MASPAQIFANRENAQHSTGPKTEEGKRASSRNALRHGLTGSQIVIPGEDPAAYESMRQGLHAHYAPATEAERILVDQIAAGSWRLDRALRVETALFRKLSEEYENSDDAIAAAFLERPADMARIQRYVTAANLAYFKAMNQLHKMQKERKEAEQEAAMAATLSATPAVSKPSVEPSVPVQTQQLPSQDSSNILEQNGSESAVTYASCV